MFFILSKTLGILSVPSHVILLLVVAGLILLRTRWARAGRYLLVACVAIFLVVGMFPVGKALIATLEDRFPAWTPTVAPPDGIIILGGPIRLGLSKARGTIELNESAERFTVIPELARRYPNARIVFSGGSGNLLAGGLSEAPYALRLLESFGIPRERILLEDRSRNTAENGLFTKALLTPKPGDRWLLVTSAAHMPRAVGVFRKLGFPVEPYPVDWQTDVSSDPWWRWLRPSFSPFRGWWTIDDAAKEWVGLLAYWLGGNTAELFPAPSPAAPAPADKRP